jgi:hypothetical protein
VIVYVNGEQFIPTENDQLFPVHYMMNRHQYHDNRYMLAAVCLAKQTGLLIFIGDVFIK